MKIRISDILFEAMRELPSGTKHMYDRLEDRVDNLDIDYNDKEEVYDNIDIVKNKFFDRRKSYGIRLAKFNVDKNHKNAIGSGNKYYYRIFDEQGKDSTGDEIWIVIRNNQIKTLFIRKSGQNSSLGRIKNKLRVDEVIFL